MAYLVHALTRTDGKLRSRQIGEYWNFDEAVTAAKQEIDSFLYREHKRAVWNGISAEKLFLLYKNAGEAILVVPKVQKETLVLNFDHLEYAAKKCAEICAAAPAASPPKT
jgi:hypothetical protein